MGHVGGMPRNSVQRKLWDSKITESRRQRGPKNRKNIEVSEKYE